MLDLCSNKLRISEFYGVKKKSLNETHISETRRVDMKFEKKESVVTICFKALAEHKLWCRLNNGKIK